MRLLQIGDLIGSGRSGISGSNTIVEQYINNVDSKTDTSVIQFKIFPSSCALY